MTRYAAELYLDEWIRPYIDIDAWDFYDLSCKSRDDTEDKVLHDCIAAGKRVGAIYKEPTVTPTEIQREEMGLKKHGVVQTVSCAQAGTASVFLVIFLVTLFTYQA